MRIRCLLDNAKNRNETQHGTRLHIILIYLIEQISILITSNSFLFIYLDIYLSNVIDMN